MVRNERWGLSWQLFFPSHLNDYTTKEECAPAIMALQYVDTAVESSELYCYNIEGISQAPCRMDVTRLEHVM